MSKSPVEAKREFPEVANLIARLEAAAGPDRELDSDIAIASGAAPDDATKYKPGKFGVGGYGHWDAPAYTASIDAALTLVPEGYYGRAWFGERPPHIACHESTAAIWAIDTKVQHSVFGCSSKQTLPAIALCIAALKARAATPPRAGGRK